MASFKQVANDMDREERDEELRLNNIRVELNARANSVCEDFKSYAADANLPVEATVDDTVVRIKDKSGEQFLIYPIEGGKFNTAVQHKVDGLGISNFSDRNSKIEADEMQRLVIQWCRGAINNF